MTSYSVLRSSQRATVIATWPGEWSDHSANVTTLVDGGQASELAHLLTRLSEDAWDAAAFLDTYPAIETGIRAFIEQLRSPAGKIEAIGLPEGGYRHTGQWSFTDIQDLLATDLPLAAGTLTRPQRLTVADELEADAAERAGALQVLPAGRDPDSERSRAWQMCEVTRALRNGLTGPLPEGAAGWLVRGWGPDHGPAGRWAARGRLVRIEQLVAACKAHGGRGRPAADPLVAHLVVPHAGPYEDDEVIYVGVHPDGQHPWDTPPTAPVIITSCRGTPGQRSDLGELDPGDDDGFARLLGEWTRLVPYRG